MRKILNNLNQDTGISGSMVITPDGIMVAAALSPDLEEDAVAAFAASLLVALKRGLSRLRAAGNLASCTLAGTEGKVVFYDMENSYLVLLGESDTSFESNAEAIQRAIREIVNRRVA